MNKSGKRNIAFLLSAVMLSGAVFAGCGENSEAGNGDNSKGSSPTYEESIINQVQENEKNKQSSAEESEEASGSAGENSKTVTTEKMGWKFKQLSDLKFENSTYTTIQPFKNLQLIKGTIALPSYKIDVPKVQKLLKEDKVLSKNIKFAEYNSERRTFKEYENEGTLAAYYRRNYLVGYRNDNKDVPVSPTDDNVEISFGYATDSTGYDAPEFYEFNVKNTKLGQEDMLNTVMNVFGKDVGRYLVEGEMEEKIDNDDSSDTLSFQKEFYTDDFNSTYTLQRKLTYNKNANSYSYAFRIVLFDTEISRNNRYNKFEWGLHSYKPFTPTLDLSHMLTGDVGVTDLSNQQSLFNKALNYGAPLDNYGRTSFANSSGDTINLEEMYFDNGETVYDYEVLAERKNEFDSDTLSGDVYLKINGVKDKDNKFTLRGFTFTLPNCAVEKAKYNKREELYKQINEQCKKQAVALFGYKEVLLKYAVQESSEEEEEISIQESSQSSAQGSSQSSIEEREDEKIRTEYQNQKIKIFGKEVNTELVFNINPTDTVYKANITVKMLNN